MRILLPVLIALCTSFACASAQTNETQSLTLRPGDVIRVQIYQEEDISGEYQIDSDGMVILPLIGARQAAGIPISALRDSLVSNFRQHLRNPAIVITPLRRVHVLGEVNRPGMYPLDPTMTLAGAIALAGGTTPTGDLRRVRIVRDGRMIRERVGSAVTLTAADVRSDDQIIVERRSWFERNSTFVVSTVLSLTSIAIAIINNK